MKVLITPRSFGKNSDEAFRRLEEGGFEIIRKADGSIYTEEEMKAAVEDADAVIVGVDPMNADVLSCAKKLKMISKYGVGTDNIDLDYCKEHVITMKITRGANSAAVADFAFALMLGLARRMVEIDKGCRVGDWSKKESLDVYGKKLGVLGLGAIGKGVVRRARGFDMEIYGYDVFRDEAFLKENHVKFADVEEIFRECDFISVHLPLLKETEHLIDKELLSMAKKNLILINTARGGIIDEKDLYEALKEGRIYGAGIDAFECEPASESPLLELDNVILGSHCAASTRGAVDKMTEMAASHVLEYFGREESGK